MYYRDITPYEHSTYQKIPNVLNVGWLDKAQDFEKGEPVHGFLDKLRQILIAEGEFECRVNHKRGVHACHICGQNSFPELYVGSCELWLPSVETDNYFAAPSTIIHYIQDHNYRPPQFFVESVLQLCLKNSFNAELFYEIAKQYPGW